MSSTRQTIQLFLLATLTTTLVSGCEQDTAKPPGRIDDDPLPSSEYPQIAVLEGLKGWLAAGKIVEEPGPPVAVTVPVRALTDDKELSVQYRFFFLDEKGIPLDGNPDWHYMKMPSRSQVFMRANALDSNAKTWRLEIRPAR